MTLAYPAVAIGYGQAEIALAPIVVDPQIQPVAPVNRAYAVSGAIHDHGHFCEWHWAVNESEEDYLAILTQLGLHNALNSELTINTRSGRLQWAMYNALATVPEPMADVKWDLWPAGIVVRFTKLVAL